MPNFVAVALDRGRSFFLKRPLNCLGGVRRKVEVEHRGDDWETDHCWSVKKGEIVFKVKITVPSVLLMGRGIKSASNPAFGEMQAPSRLQSPTKNMCLLHWMRPCPTSQI